MKKPVKKTRSSVDGANRSYNSRGTLGAGKRDKNGETATERRYLVLVVGRQVSWTVYLLRCGDKSLYCGVTTDVQRRLRQHQEGRGGSYTRSHYPQAVVYQETVWTRSQALRREIVIKRLSKAEKEKLVRSWRPTSPT